MTIQRLCKVCGHWHDLDQPWPVDCYKGPKADRAPNVISDSMEPTKHHGTGRMISSKRAFSAETRAAGMVELGNEPIRDRAPIPLNRMQRKDDIRKAVYQIRNGIREG